MNEEIKQHLKTFNWEPWLRRPFSPFLLPFFASGTDHAAFADIGFKNTAVDSILYQADSWYLDKTLFQDMLPSMRVWLETHRIEDLSKQHQAFYEESKQTIQTLIEHPTDNEFKHFFDILQKTTVYIWVTHPLEFYFDELIEIEVPKYVSQDQFEFISAASAPKKKTAHALMEQQMLAGVDASEIANKFGWLRVRDGFSDPFSAADIEAIRKTVTPAHIDNVAIPAELQGLFEGVRELVYLRTHRTDAFYHLLYLGRPIIQRLAQKIGVAFQELQAYNAQALSEGRIEKIEPFVTFASHKGNVYFFDERIAKAIQEKEVTQVKGNIAQKGYAKGTAKIVRFVSDLDKVKKGDILVTQMTFPAYIAAMHRAAAFVTDEGGLTCHAAIVAREMKKPCVIATKRATDVFKDGDIVEVDADAGVVRKV